MLSKFSIIFSRDIFCISDYRSCWKVCKKPWQCKMVIIKVCCCSVVGTVGKLDWVFFWNFFRNKNFKGTIKETSRYKRIIEVIQSDLAQHYLAFCAFSSQDFEEFLLKFQSEQPVIHLLYSSMEKLLFLMQKFVTKKYLFWSNGSAKSSSELVKLDVYNRNHQKSSRLIETGTKAKVLFSGNLVWDEKQDLFRKECQLFYPKGVMYLRQNSPFDIAILKYAQFLQPEKRSNLGSTSGISNLAVEVAKALERMICKMFQVPESDSWEQVCDKIRTQWIAYQLGDIPKEFYTKSNDEASKSSRRTNSYWSYTLELCGLQPI